MEQLVIDKVSHSFGAAFQDDPVLIFSPGRINFIGEHTDYNNGFVFPAAIDKGIYLAIANSTNERSEIRALDLNESFTCNLNQPDAKPQGSWQDYFLGILSELKQEKFSKLGQVNVVFSGTIPIGSGMSSSAALENAFIFALNQLFGLKLTKSQMIHMSQKAEQNFVGVNCGIMDQYASMFGKLDAAIFLDCESLKSELYQLELNGVEILIINSNVKHKLSESGYNDRRATCEKVCDIANVTSLRALQGRDLQSMNNVLTQDEITKASFVLKENTRVEEFCEAVTQKNILKMGALMYASHEGLKSEYQVSCDEMDFLVEFGLKNKSVFGSRMMGGGFGGCTINLVGADKVEEFKAQIHAGYKEKFNKSCDFIKVKLSDGTREIKQ